MLHLPLIGWIIFPNIITKCMQHGQSQSSRTEGELQEAYQWKEIFTLVRPLALGYYFAMKFVIQFNYVLKVNRLLNRNILTKSTNSVLPFMAQKVKLILYYIHKCQLWSDGSRAAMSNPRPSRRLCADQFRFRCRKSSLHTDNLSLLW